jgi:hypothetical protein
MSTHHTSINKIGFAALITLAVCDVVLWWAIIASVIIRSLS